MVIVANIMAILAY